MPPGELVQFVAELLAMVLVVLGIVRLWRWWCSDERRVKSLLGSARQVRIADAEEGALVKVVGKVRSAGKVLSAPGTGEPCLVWKLGVEAVGMRDQRRHVVTRSDATDFWLEDESGRALVKPLTPELRLAVHELRFRGVGEMPAAVAEILVAHESAARGRDLFHASGTDLVCQEGLVTEGETVAVLGRAHWVEDAEGAGYRERGKRLVLEDHPPLVRRISDDPELVD